MSRITFMLMTTGLLFFGGMVLKSNVLFFLAPIAAVFTVGVTVKELMNLATKEKTTTVVNCPEKPAIKTTPRRTSKLNRTDKQLEDLGTKYEYNDTTGQLVPLLGEIRTLLQRYNADILGNSKMSKFVTSEMLNQAENLFNTLIDQLEMCYNLGKSYQMATGESKAKIAKNRSSILDEIRKILDETITNIDELVNLTNKPAQEQMTKLSHDFNFELEVAMKTQKEFADMGFDENRLTKE